MRCESCRSGDSVCNSWEPCDTGIAHERAAARHPDLANDAHVHHHSPALDRAGCPRCGTPLPPASVDPDEDRDGLVVEAVVCGCGYERVAVPMRPGEVRAWVRERLALVRQRKEAS